ncbi:hypothetical protein MUK42_35432 [Musa troglodytarum]|uniref:Uncharacterized protein n=1 Tax=Musa troglodytarum TaxID=320322 RepID=A0A9E7FLH5_9LILI|nr:hypothetical protein MUK42_35432 [Musa troglodytarum]
MVYNEILNMCRNADAIGGVLSVKVLHGCFEAETCRSVEWETRKMGYNPTQPNYSTIKDREEESKRAIVLCKHKPLFSLHNLISFLLGFQNPYDLHNPIFMIAQLQELQPCPAYLGRQPCQVTGVGCKKTNASSVDSSSRGKF